MSVFANEYGDSGGRTDIEDVTHHGLRKLLGLLENVKPQEANKPGLLASWMACCPAHDDRSPSLSIGWWQNGRVSIRCFAEDGCSRDRILREVGMSSAEVGPPRATHAKSEIVAEYDYRDEFGTLLYQYYRMEPKKIRARRPDGKGGWVHTLGNARRVLYRLPELVDAVAGGITIFICEGEKDADRLVSLGLAATCNPGGAGKWRSEYTQFLAGAPVVLLQDNDSSGEAHVRRIAGDLNGVAASVRILCFTELPPKSDVSDWLDLGHTAEELRAVASAAPLVNTGAVVLSTRWDTDDPHRELFKMDDQGIWLLTNEGPKRQTNFKAKISADVVEDDGAERRRVYEITASVATEAPETFRIPATDFFEMKWHLVHIGARAAIMPSARTSTVRYAIQVLSAPIGRRTIYMHTGFREVRPGYFVFLHAGGAICPEGVVEDTDVRLDGQLAGFVLPPPPSLEAQKSAVRASLSLLELAPDRLMVPLLAATWRAPLGGMDFGLHLAGPTGAGKSELAALCQQHYGSTLDARHLPASWSSTGNALEGTAFLAKDVLLVVDDFCPRGSRNEVDALQRMADRLFRAQGNSAGRARMRQDASLRPVKPPRCLILSTGEDVPVGQSLAARVLILEVGKDDLDFSNKLSLAQGMAAEGQLATCMSGYVQYLASRMSQVAAGQRMELQRLRARAVSEDVHRRTPGIVASLMLGVMRFVEYACSLGVFDSQTGAAFEKRAWTALMEAGKLQAVYQTDDSPASVFIRGVSAALASGAAHLTDAKGGCPPNPDACGWSCEISGDDERWRPKGPRIGFIENTDVYLLQESSHRVAQQMTEGSSSRLAIGLPRLRRVLSQEGKLKSVGARGEQSYIQTRKHFEGQRIYVLHFDVSVFGLEGEQDRRERQDQEPM